jgi:hypothetical protein
LKCPFLHLMILSTLFHTFLKLKTSNKKCTCKNESIYPFGKFKENPPIIKKLSWMSLLFCSFFTLSFSF